MSCGMWKAINEAQLVMAEALKEMAERNGDEVAAAMMQRVITNCQRLEYMEGA